MVSLETLLPDESVVKPRMISASVTCKVSATRDAPVPPIVTLPTTFKFLRTSRSLRITTSSVNPIVTPVPATDVSISPLVPRMDRF